LAAAIFLLGIIPGQAADIQINAQFEASTGQSEVDALLRQFNVVAGNKLNVFITDLTSAYSVPAEDVRFLIYEQKVQPADALMILQLVKITGKPVRHVVKRYHKHRKKGWGAIALAYGIKPGTQNWVIFTERIPSNIWRYEVIEVRGSKGSHGSKHWRGSKGSKGSKHGHKWKGSKGSKHKGSKHKGKHKH
jgi:hypothetical protein